MPGRHASADRTRFRRDLIRLVVLVALAVAVAVGAALIIDYLRSGPEEPGAAATTTGEPETATTTAPSTTAPRPTTTVVTTTSTATTVATTVPETTSSTVRPVRSPDRLTVLVLNSTRVTGLAGRVTERLSDLGYRTLDPDNHPEALQTSVVWYVEGFRLEAEVLAEAIPDAEVQPFGGDDPRAPLTVVLGASYRE